MSKLNKIISSIKNGKMAGLQSVQIKSSFSKSSIDFVNILYKEGFIRGFKYKGSLDSDYNEGNLIIYLKYSKTGKNVINSIIQISKPGRRVYSGIRPLWKLKNGFGIFILSTPKGVLPDYEARFLNVGGEVLCAVV